MGRQACPAAFSAMRVPRFSYFPNACGRGRADVKPSSLPYKAALDGRNTTAQRRHICVSGFPAGGRGRAQMMPLGSRSPVGRNGAPSLGLLGADPEDTHEKDAVLSSAASALNGRAAAAGAPALASLCLPSLAAYSNTLTSCISIPCGQTKCFYSPEDLLFQKGLKERDKRVSGEKGGEKPPTLSVASASCGRAGLERRVSVRVSAAASPALGRRV